MMASIIGVIIINDLRVLSVAVWSLLTYVYILFIGKDV
ncbi:hypothetical protein MNB_SM-6-1498 [hydrothermal vent metagenome]|uniref:Uncharacterized protein n=1 Tax=hydrothermal vent metagenome TaxID=652676 RepID=A0A1W1CR21_9ZZZZ